MALSEYMHLGGVQSNIELSMDFSSRAVRSAFRTQAGETCRRQGLLFVQVRWVSLVLRKVQLHAEIFVLSHELHHFGKGFCPNPA